MEMGRDLPHRAGVYAGLRTRLEAARDARADFFDSEKWARLGIPLSLSISLFLLSLSSPSHLSLSHTHSRLSLLRLILSLSHLFLSLS